MTFFRFYENLWMPFKGGLLPRHFGKGNKGSGLLWPTKTAAQWVGQSRHMHWVFNYVICHLNVVSRSIFIALFNGSCKFCNFSRVLLLLKRLAHYNEFLRLVVVSFGLALHLHTPYFPAQTAATRLILLSVVASSMQQRVGFFSAKYKMHCLSAPRVLPKTSAADEECWGNVSLLPESQARACGFSTEATLCKSTTTKKTKQIKLLLPITWWWRLRWESCFISKAIISTVRLLQKS